MTENRSKQRGVRPVWIALAIAIFGIFAMLIVDHGPRSRAHVQTAELANHQTTGEAARSAGAAVEPTAPRPALEPQAPGPKPMQPPIPDTH
jgi:anti-sigma factor RsiW